MFKRTVVGYGGDQAGRDALALTARLEALFATVTVVYPYSPLLRMIRSDVVEKRVRSEIASLHGDSPALTRATYRWSSASWPIHALHSMAAFDHAELIVTGAAHQRAALSHVSFVERMVHGAPCAVALAPAGYAEAAFPSNGRIGVGFEETAEGKAALLLAHHIAHRLGSELEVIAGSHMVANVAMYGFASALRPELEDELYAATTTGIERAVVDLPAGVPVHTDIQREDPSRLLGRRSHHLDLLLLGSRAYGPLRHALLGSVSAAAVRNSRCPVLVVPRGAAEQAEDLA